jgi:hypothetical protein
MTRLRAIFTVPLFILALIVALVVGLITMASSANATTMVSAHVDLPLPPPAAYSNFGGTPANTVRMYEFLRDHGYTNNGALGVIGNISVESGGNPEQTGFGSPGDGGLIMWTPMSEYNIAITGNVTQDLYQQLDQVLNYNDQNGGGGALDALNSAPNPGAAATIYAQYFERCDVAAPSCSGSERAGAAYDASHLMARYGY